MKKNLLLVLAVCFFWIGCSDEDSSVSVATPEVSAEKFVIPNFSVDSLDKVSHKIFVKPKKDDCDSITFENVGKILELSGGAVAYKANSADETDPDIVNWDFPLEDGVAVPLNGSNTLIFVVLDEDNSVTDIWKVVLPVNNSNSGSGKSAFSSSEKKGVSSSSAVVSSCSESGKEKSSSSMKAVSSSAKVESSSGKIESGSAKVESSSAKAKSSSSVKPESSSSDRKESSSSEKGKNSSSSKGVEQKSSSSVKEDRSSSSVKPESSSSSKEESSSSGGKVEESSSSELPVLSSEKNIESFQIWVSGSRASNAVKDDASKTISLKLATTAAVDSVQMYRLGLSEGAKASVLLKKDLSLTKVGDFTYEYAFTVTAEDGSSDDWKILVSIPKGVNLNDFAVGVEDSRVSVNGNKIYVEIPYDSTLDLMALKVLPMDTMANLLRPLKMNFVDENDELQTYEVVVGMQLPGTNFNSLDLDFWGTTSNAMGVSATVADINISAKENLSVGESGITMKSQTLVGAEALTGITGSRKLAGGFYFTGSYSGISTMSLYDRTNSGSTPSLSNSDISADMTFGRPFMCRPESFSVKYSYVHVANSDASYPQQYLIYVLLVSEDNYIVAGGVLTGKTSVSSDEQVVPLVYGEDVGIMASKFPKSSFAGIDGSKDVAYIHVMFASSAYAYVVAGGTTVLNDPSKKYRGGDGASLTIESFRLNY